MLPTVQKFLGRVFAHREQECPSGKGSFPRKVNKTRKTGFLGTAAPTLHQHFQAEPSAAYLPQVVCLSVDRARLAVGVDPKEISAQRGWYVKPRSGSLPSLLGGFLSSIFAFFWSVDVRDFACFIGFPAPRRWFRPVFGRVLDRTFLFIFGRFMIPFGGFLFRGFSSSFLAALSQGAI
jgi:hypothetical protein